MRRMVTPLRGGRRRTWEDGSLPEKPNYNVWVFMMMVGVVDRCFDAGVGGALFDDECALALGWVAFALALATVFNLQ